MTTIAEAPYFSKNKVLHLSGATYRQLDVWSRDGLLHPTLPGGSGFPRKWTLVEVQVARVLTAASALMLPKQKAMLSGIASTLYAHSNKLDDEHVVIAYLLEGAICFDVIHYLDLASFLEAPGVSMWSYRIESVSQ